MADGGIGNQSPATLFQARLLTADNVGPTLKLGQYNGNKVVVSGVTVVVPQTGLARDIADNLITAAGADAGAAPAASTLYYVYVSNKRASFSPESIRLSSQAPIFVNGVKYLGNAGNALNWRFVGWVRPNATPNFESTSTSRLIVNYYNRNRLSMFTCPGYVDDNAITQYNTNSTTWVECNAGVGSKLEFISNGEDAVDYKANFYVTPAAAGYSGVGVGEDSITQAAVAGVVGTGAGAQDLSANITKSPTLAEGYHALNMLFCTNGVTTTTMTADFGRFGGSAVDEPATVISATVLG